MTDSLLSRLQSLTGPDREVDAEIALANGWTEPWSGADHANGYWRSPDGKDHRNPPRYTESLDAALTALPSGYYWIVGAGMTRPDEPLYGAQIMRPIMRPGADGPDIIGEGETDATPAIALFIAIERMKEDSKS